MYRTVAFTLKGIPEVLWGRVRLRAKRDGMSLRGVMLELIRYYVRHGLPPHERVS